MFFKSQRSERTTGWHVALMYLLVASSVNIDSVQARVGAGGSTTDDQEVTSAADKQDFHLLDHTDLYTVKRDRDLAWNATASLRDSVTSFGGLNSILTFFRRGSQSAAGDAQQEKDVLADVESVEDSSTQQDLRQTSEPLRETFDRLAAEDMDPRDEDTSVEDFPVEDTPVEVTPDSSFSKLGQGSTRPSNHPTIQPSNHRPPSVVDNSIVRSATTGNERIDALIFSEEERKHKREFLHGRWDRIQKSKNAGQVVYEWIFMPVKSKCLSSDTCPPLAAEEHFREIYEDIDHHSKSEAVLQVLADRSRWYPHSDKANRDVKCMHPHKHLIPSWCKGELGADGRLSMDVDVSEKEWVKKAYLRQKQKFELLAKRKLFQSTNRTKDSELRRITLRSKALKDQALRLEEEGAELARQAAELAADHVSFYARRFELLEELAEAEEKEAAAHQFVENARDNVKARRERDNVVLKTAGEREVRVDQAKVNQAVPRETK
eukprot:CAMPEP_0198206262 /NCGR_PEP_ID=MMETSP1445-20131203/9793_1 /TAXON_ID=36898 /ORGANISM="Pyramimonas sp., Strain CCMP2087" /LENGTH=490 /DNA_ID=CAMNT_0043878883 /DNA_START=222 /DNA_END=1691 /DNA_ORIENTATION=+